MTCTVLVYIFFTAYCRISGSNQPKFCGYSVLTADMLVIHKNGIYEGVKLSLSASMESSVWREWESQRAKTLLIRTFSHALEQLKNSYTICSQQCSLYSPHEKEKETNKNVEHACVYVGVVSVGAGGDVDKPCEWSRDKAFDDASVWWVE